MRMNESAERRLLFFFSFFAFSTNDDDFWWSDRGKKRSFAQNKGQKLEKKNIMHSMFRQFCDIGREQCICIGEPLRSACAVRYLLRLMTMSYNAYENHNEYCGQMVNFIMFSAHLYKRDFSTFYGISIKWCQPLDSVVSRIAPTKKINKKGKTRNENNKVMRRGENFWTTSATHVLPFFLLFS